MRKKTKILLFGVITALLLNTRQVLFTLADDASETEVGIWWVRQFYQFGDYVSNADNEAEAFQDGMYDYGGFSKSLNYGDDNAKESHWEKSSVGGDDDDYVETIDIAYYCGHGSPYNKFQFGTDNDGDDSYEMWVHASEADWGDDDLEWVFLQACEALKSYYRTNWNQVFNGLHGICGFDTEASAFYSGQTGNATAFFLCSDGYSVHEAWEEGTGLTQYNDRDGAIYYANIRIEGETNYYGDEPIDDMLPDYGGAIIKTGYTYDEWNCYGGVNPD